MSKLLYIQASPRVERSHSRAVADAFVEAYKKKNTGDRVTALDLFQAELPAFDGLAVQAKYTILHGKKHTAEEQSAWKAVERTIADFKAADKYVFAVPMWNFGIPYRLKQYIDILVQPGYTFSFSPEAGYKGLVTGKPAFIAYASGGEYPSGTDAESMDFQRRYLNFLLGFIGFTDIRSVAIEPTLGSDPESRRKAAIARARELAATF